MHINTQVYIDTYIYIHIHTYIYIHVYIYRYMQQPGRTEPLATALSPDSSSARYGSTDANEALAEETPRAQPLVHGPPSR